MLADPALLERILANLAANAERYSPAGKQVLLTASSHNDRVELRVATQRLAEQVRHIRGDQGGHRLQHRVGDPAPHHDHTSRHHGAGRRAAARQNGELPGPMQQGSRRGHRRAARFALAAERQRATGDARAAERARIAREIHDAISQHLFALRMIAAGMRRADPGNQQARAIERVSEEALREMQALLTELRPARPDGTGLAPALQEICAAYQHRLGVTVDASLDDVTVPAPVEHALLRIAQEACTNAVRHGSARRLAMSLTRQDGHVELAVRDTGTGFDPAAPHAGSGLAHIRDRAAELGGTVDIDSAPGRGAALTVRVPVP